MAKRKTAARETLGGRNPGFSRTLLLLVLMPTSPGCCVLVCHPSILPHTPSLVLEPKRPTITILPCEGRKPTQRGQVSGTGHVSEPWLLSCRQLSTHILSFPTLQTQESRPEVTLKPPGEHIIPLPPAWMPGMIASTCNSSIGGWRQEDQEFQESHGCMV